MSINKVLHATGPKAAAGVAAASVGAAALLSRKSKHQGIQTKTYKSNQAFIKDMYKKGHVPSPKSREYKEHNAWLNNHPEALRAGYNP